MKQSGVARESLVDHTDLFYIRRQSTGGRDYFIANRSAKSLKGWIPLATTARSVALMDAMTGRIGTGAVRATGAGIEVYLQLEPGESIIVRTLTGEQATASAWPYWKSIAAGSRGFQANDMTSIR